MLLYVIGFDRKLRFIYAHKTSSCKILERRPMLFRLLSITGVVSRTYYSKRVAKATKQATKHTMRGSVSRIRRKAQRDRAGSRLALRHPVCRGTKSMHLARSIGPILESCLFLTQVTLSLSSSSRLLLSPSLLFSFYWDLPRKTLFDGG